MDDVATEPCAPPSAFRRWLAGPWPSRLLTVAGLGLLVWMVTRFPLSAIGDACLDLGFGVFLMPVIALGWMAAGAMALYQLLGGRVPWLALFWNRVVGDGYNAIIPAAGVGGEPVKLRQLTRYVETHRAVVALINDRLIDNSIAFMFSASCVGIGAYYVDAPPALHTTMVSYAIGAGIAGIAIALVLVTNITNRAGARIARWIGGS